MSMSASEEFRSLIKDVRHRAPDATETLFLFEATAECPEALDLLCEAACLVRDEEMAGRTEVEAAFNSVVPCYLEPLCQYCPYWRSPDKAALSIDEILEGVRFLREESEIRQFHLSGGSMPGGRDCGVIDIVEAIRHAGYDDMDIVVNCGASFSDAGLARLKELDVKRIFSVFETTNPDVFRQVKPGDDLEEKMAFAHRIAATGMEVGSGIMAGLGPAETKYPDYVKALFDLKSLEQLSCVYVSKFRHANHIPLNDHPECSADEGRALIALTRLVLRDTHIRAAAGWDRTTHHLAAEAGAGSITIPKSFSSGSDHWPA